MRFTAAILAMAISGPPEVSIYDSKTEPGQSWILIDDCAAKVKTQDIKDYPNKIVDEVYNFCKGHIEKNNQKQ